MSSARLARGAARVAPLLSAGCLFFSACLLSGCSGSEPTAGATDDPAALLRGDRRVAELLAGCTQSGFYDRDLSDLAPILVAKLERGRPEALKRAKEELGQLGTAAFPALAQAFHASYSDAMRSGTLENVVDALAFSACEEAHALRLEALRHPQESVRGKALDGMARQAHAEDFTLVAERLAIETPELRRKSVAALFASDRVRAEAFILDAFEQGTERDLWILAAMQLPETTTPEHARRCGALYASLDRHFAPHVAVAAARGGDEQALEFVRAALRSEDTQQRLVTATALQRAGMVDELAWTLREDVSGEARAIAASALGKAAPSAERDAWLRAALDDANPTVRGEALSGLCARDDAEGLARALAQLEGDAQALTHALTALRAPLSRSHELAADALERLLGRHALEEHRPLSQRIATLKAIGQIPLPEAAAFLRRIGLEAGDEHLESLRAHDWLMIQASNTGLPGRTYLAEELTREQDPLRRLDLVDALGSQRDELARTALLALLESGKSSPLETLFAASVVIKVGPASEVAPRLKRVAFALQGPDSGEARTGLQCLLWLWY